MSSHERQKELSKKWLGDSLLKLMQVKPYDKITVSEIAVNADLARRTFYRTFSSKNDVIAYVVENLVSEYIDDLSMNQALNLESLVVTFFGFFEKYRELILIFKRNHLEYFILESFNKYLPKIRRMVCIEKMSDDLETDKIFMLISAGGFFNLLMHWIDSDSNLTVREMSQLVPQAVKLFTSYL